VFRKKALSLFQSKQAHWLPLVVRRQPPHWLPAGTGCSQPTTTGRHEKGTRWKARFHWSSEFSRALKSARVLQRSFASLLPRRRCREIASSSDCSCAPAGSVAMNATQRIRDETSSPRNYPRITFRGETSAENFPRRTFCGVTSAENFPGRTFRGELSAEFRFCSGNSTLNQ